MVGRNLAEKRAARSTLNCFLGLCKSMFGPSVPVKNTCRLGHGLEADLKRLFYCGDM